MSRIIFFAVAFMFFSNVSYGNEAGLEFYDRETGVSYESKGIASDIEIRVSGLLYRTKTTQYFYNDSEYWREAIYTYPLPEKSSVDKLTMMIGDKRITGFVARKEEARKIYEQAKKEGKASSLIEQHRPNLFKTNIANIPPKTIIAVEIGYQSEISYDAGEFKIHVPFAITPRYGNIDPYKLLEKPKDQYVEVSDFVNKLSLFDFEDGNNTVSLNVIIDKSMELNNFNSISHGDFNIKDTDDFYYLSNAGNIMAGDHDFILSWEVKYPEKNHIMLQKQEVDGEYYYQVGIVPKIIGNEVKINKPRQVSFVLDVSGSMAGESLRQAKKALIVAIDDLEDNDLFNLIVFDTEAEKIFDNVVAADQANKSFVQGWISNLEVRGGTNMLPAVEMALEQKLLDNYLGQVIFITDGAIDYEDTLYNYIKDNAGDNRFYGVGIGYAPNTHLMNLIAEAGRGSATIVSDISQVSEIMGKLFAKMKSPILTDIKISIDEAVDIIPAKIKDVLQGDIVSFSMTSNVDIKEFEIEGAEIDGGLWVKSFDLRGAGNFEGTAQIYARNKIHELNYLRNNELSFDDIKEMIAKLGVKFQMLTKYTSLVAVDDEKLRPYWEQLTLKIHNPNLPKSWKDARGNSRYASMAYDEMKKDEEAKRKANSEMREQLGLPKTATGYELKILMGVILILIGFSLFIGSRRKL